MVRSSARLGRATLLACRRGHLKHLYSALQLSCDPTYGPGKVKTPIHPSVWSHFTPRFPNPLQLDLANKNLKPINVNLCHRFCGACIQRQTSSSGLWSKDISTATPFLHTTHLESHTANAWLHLIGKGIQPRVSCIGDKELGACKQSHNCCAS